MAVLTKAQIEQLDVATRLELIDQLWDSIASDPEATAELPVDQDELNEMRMRLAEYRANPEVARPWPEVRAELTKLK